MKASKTENWFQTGFQQQISFFGLPKNGINIPSFSVAALNGIFSQLYFDKL